MFVINAVTLGDGLLNLVRVVVASALTLPFTMVATLKLTSTYWNEYAELTTLLRENDRASTEIGDAGWKYITFDRP